VRRILARSLIAATALLAVVLSGCTGRSEPGPTPESYPAGTSVHTLEFDGDQRSYRVYVPPTLAGGPAARVVMLHGGFGSAEQAELVYGWDAQADREGFVVAYPEGEGRSWNAGGCCGPAMKRDLDDVGFVEAVVRRVGTGLDIDPDRRFATGMSNGGILAYRLACESGVFAAIAPVSATMLVDCDAPGPVSVLHIHGALDQSVPPDGSPGAGTQNIDGPPLAEVLAYWRGVDGCGEPEEGGDAMVATSTASGCDSGTAVEYVEVADAGHQWPGATSSEIRDELGGDPPSTRLDATAEIAAFFAEHPRQATG
jgi:polyhydroxybutyrate depolymerase